MPARGPHPGRNGFACSVDHDRERPASVRQSMRGGIVTAATEAPNNSNVIYAVTNYDTVFVTQNANAGNGAVWTQVTQQHHPGGISAVTVDPTNYQTAYLACDSGIYKTTDMGTSWTQYGIPDLIYRDVAIDPAYPQHIFAASNAGVFASTDGGGNWGNMSEGIPAGMVVSALSFNAASRQLAASTYGRGVYYAQREPIRAAASQAASHSVSEAIIFRVTARGHITSYTIGIRLRGSTRRPTNR